MHQRCIGCGSCVKVCSQEAKVYVQTIDEVVEFLKAPGKVAAMIAPSFPAEFIDISDYHVLIGMIRKLGFDYVTEVGFGADMIAREYSRILSDHSSEPCISSDCPAVVYFVEHYHPDSVKSLAPIASPMVAINRIVHKKYGDDVKTIFIGPCVAKKAESDEIDEVITFRELREMFEMFNITPDQIEPTDFDPPHAGKGGIFPVSRGLLQTTNVAESIIDGLIIIAGGRLKMREAVKEFEDGDLGQQHLEVLCCEGCIMGPGMSKGGKRYIRRKQVGNYVSQRLHDLDKDQWKRDIREFSSVDFSQTFEPLDRRLQTPSADLIEKALQTMGKYTEKDHLNCGACGYDTCFEHAMAIAEGLAETEMCLPYTIESLHNTIQALNISNESLETAQQALRQSEKLAGMGQLSAGIAHELNNPLGVITMYSNILLDELPEDHPMRKDLALISEQADRCKKIVGGLLNFARKNQVYLVETNMLAFVKKSMDSVIHPKSVELVFKHNLSNPLAFVDNDQMMQALTNLEKNAIEAMPTGGKLSIELTDNETEVIIRISDSGSGIPQEDMEKIFTPFFTTKELGKGTGLGLPLVYGIVKMHRGKIDVVSNADKNKGRTGTTFSITLPRFKSV
jgi:iron only hydrogenase large subunit-like protein/nitrogen-specific signal transduction histidine kinase